MIKTIALILFSMVVSLEPSWASITSARLLEKVKIAEKGFSDFKADMEVKEANKENVLQFEESRPELLKLKKAVVYFKSPDKLRIEGFAEGLKATFIQNGMDKLVLAAMVRHKENLKGKPGKRQNSLDMGFLSSALWKENKIRILSVDRSGIVKMDLDPIDGPADDKRHDIIWVDSKSLRLIKRERYRGSGELKLIIEYSDSKNLTKTLPIATQSRLLTAKGEELGVIAYKNISVNVGLDNALFNVNQKRQ